MRINKTPARISPIAANKITEASTIPGSRVFMAKLKAIRRTTSDPPINPHPANSRTQKNITLTPALHGPPETDLLLIQWFNRSLYGQILAEQTRCRYPPALNSPLPARSGRC